MIIFDKLWIVMKDRDISTYQLRENVALTVRQYDTYGQTITWRQRH